MNRNAWVLIAALMVLSGCAAHSSPGHDLLLLRQQAYQAYAKKDYDRAVTLFTRLVKEMPGDSELWFRLGNSHAGARQPKKAIEAYENALLRDPNLAKAWYNLGMVHLKQSIKTFEEMTDYVGPDHPLGQRAQQIRDALVAIMEEQIRAVSGQPAH